MSNTVRLLTLLIVGSIASGCATQAPLYTTNYAAVVQLREAGLEPVSVGSIARPPGKSGDAVEKLTIRGGTYTSPHGSFTEYLRVALRDELGRADLLNDQSTIVIDGVLRRNVLDGSGASIGFAEIEATLTIRRKGQSIYEATKSVRHEWPSSFVGAIAIPRTIEGYPLAVRKLLNEFYADPKFIEALKKK